MFHESPAMWARPLLFTADLALRENLMRLCAVVGTEAEVASDVAAARRSWCSAALVVLGADVAGDAAAAAMPRRPGVVLLGGDLDDPRVWELAARLGVESVVFLPDAESWLMNRLADAAESDARGRVVAVVGGRGGAGATTLAAALAVTAARARLRAMVVDGDPLGGGIDLAMGGEDVAGLRWPDLAASDGRLSSAALWSALPEVDGVVVLSAARGEAHPVPVAAMTAVLRAARRCSDLVVVDLPRHLDAAGEVAVGGADLTLIVVPAEVRASAAAATVATSVTRLTDRVGVVVRGPSPGGLTGDAVAEALALPLVGWCSAEPRLTEALERGEPPARNGKGPLAQLCCDVLAELAVTPEPAA